MTEVVFLCVHIGTSADPMPEHVLGSLPYQRSPTNTNVYIFQCLSVLLHIFLFLLPSVLPQFVSKCKSLSG